MWDLIKDEGVPKEDKHSTLLEFDKVLGFGFDHSDKKLVDLLSGKGEKLELGKLPKTIKKLVDEREEARKNKNFKEADKLRDKLKEEGYEIEDEEEGPEVTKN